MALKFGFYDSINGDRKYNAADFTNIFDGLIHEGVYELVGDKFRVSASNGMNLSVGSGRAWFDGVWTYTNTGETVLVQASDTNLNRLDAVVIEVDKANRTNYIKVVKGTAASTPELPVLSEGQHIIASVLVRAGVSAITNEDITNLVGTKDSPYAFITMTGIPVISYGSEEPDENTPGYGVEGSLYFKY